ncbi:MAG: RbsD/FucU domain-containing protein [Christensenella sp.]|nr:RbsD/FucU domain-containing protein [Christensenella sp.]
MLKGIPEIISPELMKVLMEMGHGDEICFGDINFPSQSVGQKVIRADGHTVTDLLDAILHFFPLDTYVEHPCAVMRPVDDSEPPQVWQEFESIIKNHDFASAYKDFELVERFAFYERAKKCYAVVATSERAGYSCIILKKGVIF